MSVVKPKRKTVLLKAVLLSVQLLQKTIDICSSKNNFPVRKKWAIPSDLYLEAREFCVNLNLANDIRATDEASAKERLRLDEEASIHLKRYKVLANTTCLIYPLGETVINSWVTLLNETDEMFNAWLRSEKQRYSSLVGQQL